MYTLSVDTVWTSAFWTPANVGGYDFMAMNSDTFSVTVQDTNGCKARDTAVITILNLPTKPFAQDTASACKDVPLDAQNPGSTYAWSNGANTQTVILNTAGYYDVTITDPSGCQNSDTVFVNFFPQPVECTPYL